MTITRKGKKYEYELPDGRIAQVTFYVSRYWNKNTRIYMYVFDEESDEFPYKIEVTKNISPLFNAQRGAIDTERLGEYVVYWLIANDIAVDIRRVIQNEYWIYPVLQFSEEWLEEHKKKMYLYR